ncbi:hypothetical protein M422DRAFT_777219 [Sphaerobolus stellatus SS14]|nr:hypothetical protein M422DRAFT_777219 [Sphaerobolus stellatus SS14]
MALIALPAYQPPLPHSPPPMRSQHSNFAPTITITATACHLPPRFAPSSRSEVVGGFTSRQLPSGGYCAAKRMPGRAPCVCCTYHLSSLPSRPSPSSPELARCTPCTHHPHLHLSPPTVPSRLSHSLPEVAGRLYTRQPSSKEYCAAKRTPWRAPCTLCTYHLLPLPSRRSPSPPRGRWQALHPPALIQGILRCKTDTMARAMHPLHLPPPAPAFPPLSLAPQSSRAGSTLVSTFLGVLRCETDARAHAMCPPSPPAPIASRRPFPSLPLAP